MKELEAPDVHAEDFDERKVFDTIPERFDRWRLRYTPELFRFLVSRCSLGPGTRCLEIGPGTGQATDFALDAGCDYTAIELGGHLAAMMRRKYGDRPNFKLIQGDFEQHPFAGGSFDFVYSAATIQWIAPSVAFSKCFDILKPGGYLAMFLLRGDYQTPNPALYRDIQKIYDEHYRTDAHYRRRFPYLDAPKYGFETEEQFSFPSSRRYTADEYIEYIHTHSDHICLREDCKEAFYGGIRDAILRHGNKIEFRDEFALYLCRKPVPPSGENRGLRLLPLRAEPGLKAAAAAWFHAKWGVPEEVYRTCMDDYLARRTEYGWYLCLDGDRIVGGLGVVENDFHERKDLAPNICAVYTEESHRGRGIAGRLLDLAVGDLRGGGISPVYLVTDHTGFYERYGWEFLCTALGDGATKQSRIYLHR